MSGGLFVVYGGEMLLESSLHLSAPVLGDCSC